MHCGFREQTMQLSLQRLRLRKLKEEGIDKKESEVRNSLKEHGQWKEEYGGRSSNS